MHGQVQLTVADTGPAIACAAVPLALPARGLPRLRCGHTACCEQQVPPGEKCESHLGKVLPDWGHDTRTAILSSRCAAAGPLGLEWPPVVPCRALMRKSPRFTTMFFSRTRSFARALAGAQAAGEPMAVISKVPRWSGGRRTPPLRGTIPKLPAKKRGS